MHSDACRNSPSRCCDPAELFFRGKHRCGGLKTRQRVAHIRQMTQSTQTAQKTIPGLNLSGEWIGHYRGHFDQVVKLTQIGEEVVAVKITGDDHVPGGQVTFRANVKTGVGEGQVAEKEFRNACFVPGKLEVVTAERIVFTWENCGKVEFRKDD
jgi:hypothetical protein